VADDEQRHGFVLVGQFAQRRQSRGGRRLGDDAEVFAEPPAEIVPERVHHPSVVIDHEQDGLGHPRPLSRTTHCTAARTGAVGSASAPGSSAGRAC
jgi:hypothetical protein